MMDGQNIVTKPDQARLLAGWETLLNFDADSHLHEHGLAEEVEPRPPTSTSSG